MGFRITVDGAGRSVDATDGETVLAACSRAGVRVPHSCTQGNCGTCRVRLVSGAVTYDTQPLALSPEESAGGFALACQAKPASDVAIEIERADVPEPSRQMALVTDIEALSPEVLHLSLVLPELDPFNYLPGQHMNVILEDGATRSFSMASPPAGNAADFHIRRIGGGRFTGDLDTRLQPGDALEVELPLGGFGFHVEDWRPVVMAATGTGIAPFKAMLESLLDHPDCPPISLYWGARTPEELYLADTIASWGGRLFEFQFVPVLSRAGGDWTGRRGHVQQAVVEDFPDLSEHALYLCGSPAMIADAKRTLLAHGASAAHLYTEGFSFQPSA